MAANEVNVFVARGAGEGFELLDENRKVSLPVSQLKQNLSDFSAAMAEVLPSLHSPASLDLKSVSVAVGINGEGQVGFLGTGAKLGGSATLTITFERKTG